MQQLPLFDDRVMRAAVAPPEAEQPFAPGASASPGQLDLFGQRALRLARASEAIATGDLDEARRALEALVARDPADAGVLQAVARVVAIERKLRRAPGAAPSAAVLLEAARGLEPASGAWASLRRLLLRRTAEALRDAEGHDGRLEEQPPGYYFLEAGALAQARDSLRAAASARPTPRTLFLLADAHTSLGEAVAARRLYLDALLRDPFDAALAAVRDAAVRELPDVARYELEIEDEPAAWAAPVGIVTGVLPRPPEGAAGRVDTGDEQAHPPARREALGRARRFVEAFAAASSPQRRIDGAALIEARRAMKQLAPTLFAAYLARAAGALGR